MKGARAGFAVVFMALLMAGCQNATTTDLPPAIPSTSPTLDVQVLSSASPDTMNGASLDPQQLSDCFSYSVYYGYYGCWRQGINVWMYYWPYGYSYSYCYVIGYADVGGWGRWEYEFSWQLCNQ